MQSPLQEKKKVDKQQEGIPYNCIRCHQITYIKHGDPPRCKNESCKYRILLKEPRHTRVYLAR